MILSTETERRFLPDIYFMFLYESIYLKVRDSSIAIYRRKDIYKHLNFIIQVPMTNLWFEKQIKWLLSFRQNIMKNTQE